MKSTDEKPHPLRLRRKHGEGRAVEATAIDGARLARSQSLRNALVASLIAIILFCVAWILLTSALNRVLPWMTIVLGAVLGTVIRVVGRGVDWRFPTLAAVMALSGSIASNVVLAASTTAAEFSTGTLTILQAVTSMTWPVFFDEVWTVADGFFAVLAAGLAAFMAPRRLTRQQRYALRLWQAEKRDQ